MVRVRDRLLPQRGRQICVPQGGRPHVAGRRSAGVPLLLALLLFPAAADAGSVFAREGLGEWCAGYDERGRALTVTAPAFSKTAREKIEKTGGKAEVAS